MGEGFFSRGFLGRCRRHDDERLPPGQYLKDGFSVNRGRVTNARA